MGTSSVVVVTGMSGAGKSTAMNALEDLGHYVIENLPPAVVPEVIDACERKGIAKIALGFGVHQEGFVDEATVLLERLTTSTPTKPSDEVSAPTSTRAAVLLFFDASDEAVMRRFNETRRPHPLASESEPGELLAAIRTERERLLPIRAIATHVIDTSGLRVHDLRRRVLSLMRPGTQETHDMAVRVLSFGFKYGLPSDADLVFDVRFIDNPYFVPELRELTGNDPRVSGYVLAAAGAKELVEQLVGLLKFLLPRYEQEGKSYLTVAIGCTGGQHRSVAIANELARRVADGRFQIRAAHRDAHIKAGTPLPSTARESLPPPVDVIVEPRGVEKGRGRDGA